MKKSSYIKIDRNILKWDYYLNGNTFRVFMDILLRAAFDSYSQNGMKLKRGQLVIRKTSLARRLGITVSQARTALKHLEECGAITQEKSDDGKTLITVKNYDYYQETTKKQPHQPNQQKSAADGNEPREKNIDFSRWEELGYPSEEEYRKIMS